MSKIKDIHDRLVRKPAEYTNLRFAIAKQIFVGVTALYFLTYLFTVGGFYFGPISLGMLSTISYHMYSLLVIATAWFFYSLLEYWGSEYLTGGASHVYNITIGIIAFILAGMPLVMHLGLI